MNRKFSALVFCLLFSGLSWAASQYQSPTEFVEHAFEGSPPAPQLLFVGDEVEKALRKILSHAPNGKRFRYWHQGSKTVWVLEEIGKVKPITAGFVVEQGKITRAKVLVFRESRGWEIRYPYFTDQFTGASLKANLKLDQRVDGISGATLSTRAMKKMGRMALYLHHRVTQEQQSAIAK